MSDASLPPDPAAFVTRAAFAAMKGWHRSYVTKLITAGRIALTDDRRLVDVAASNRLLEESADVSKASVRERHSRRRKSPVDLAKADPAQPAAYSAFNQARTRREESLATMAEMELEERRAQLVPVGEVREMAARLAGIISRGFERIRPRIGPVWSVELDPSKREQLLEDELRKVRAEWATEIEKLIGPGGVAQAAADGVETSTQ